MSWIAGLLNRNPGRSHYSLFYDIFLVAPSSLLVPLFPISCLLSFFSIVLKLFWLLVFEYIKNGYQIFSVIYVTILHQFPSKANVSGMIDFLTHKPTSWGWLTFGSSFHHFWPFTLVWESFLHSLDFSTCAELSCLISFLTPSYLNYYHEHHATCSIQLEF